MNYKTTLSLLLTVTLALFLAGCPTEEEPPEVYEELGIDGEERVVIEYGHVPSISASERRAELRPLEEYLEENLPVEFSINFDSDYGSVIEKIKEGEYNFATFGPMSYVEAAREKAVTPAVKPLRFGEESYKSLLLAHEDSDIYEPEDFRGRSFAFVDEKSASGYLFPYAFLKDQGIDPQADLGVTSFLGGHTDVVAAVWLENYAGGAVYDDARQDMDNPERVIENTRVVAKTPPIPNEPWAFRAEFVEQYPELVEEIISLLVGLEDEGPSGKRILDSLGISGFTRAEDADYDVVRDLEDYLPEFEEEL